MISRVQVPEHLLGDHRDSTWGDMSQYAVHFTSSAATLGVILGTGCLKALGPFGFRPAPRLFPPHLGSFSASCFMLT